jgi:hypothetical protein
MIRNLKALGIAVVAVLVLSAAVGSAASAQQGTLTSTGPVTLTGVNSGAASENRFTAFGTYTECPNAKYTGHKSLTVFQTEAGKKHELIPVPATQITVAPHYGVCTTPVPLVGPFPATIDMNSCDYTFDLKETTGGVAGTYGVTATVHCLPGKDIEITDFTKGKPHTTENHFCTIVITPVTDYIGLHATDLGNGTLRIHGSIEGIEAHTKPSAWDPLFFCQEEKTTTTAKLDINLLVSGDNAAGAATNISLSHP